MKKLVIILAAVGVMSFATSCGKCGSCSSVSSYEYCVGKDGVTQDNYDSYKSACEAGGYTWTEK